VAVAACVGARADADMVSELAALEAAAEALCGALDADRLLAVPASTVAEIVTRLAVVERKVVAAKVRGVCRVESSGVWTHAGFRTVADWMAARTGDPAPQVAGLVDTARQLDQCPATADAFAAGVVSQAAVREIAAAVAVDPAAEAGLLAVAQGGDHRRLRDAAARVRQAARSEEDEAARHARLRGRRFARTRTDADGLVILSAGFAPKDWAVHAERLRHATDARFTEARREGRREGLDAYAADALLDLLTSTTSAPAPGARAPKRGRSTKAEVVVLVDGLALRRGHVAAGERCEIPGVGPVDVAWVQSLLPEAIVHALVHDGVDITTYASATRSIRRAVRLAVDVRDGGCVVQWCGDRRRTQQDHRQDFAAGGAGSTDNLNVLCVFHHNQKTRDGAKLERHGDQWHWYPPGVARPTVSAVGAGFTHWPLESDQPDSPDTS
jgi:hypothetical protein